jgi:hypothetical protein
MTLTTTLCQACMRCVQGVGGPRGSCRLGGLVARGMVSEFGARRSCEVPFGSLGICLPGGVVDAPEGSSISRLMGGASAEFDANRIDSGLCGAGMLRAGLMGSVCFTSPRTAGTNAAAMSARRNVIPVMSPLRCLPCMRVLVARERSIGQQ